MFKIQVLFVALCASAVSHANEERFWLSDVEKIQKIKEKSTDEDACNEVEFKELTKNYIFSYNEEAKVCSVYDLSFANVRALLRSVAVTELRVTRPKLNDYKIFLNNEANEDIARSFVEEESLSLDQSWYSKLRFTSKNALEKNKEGLVKEFRFSDIEIFEKDIKFSNKDKDVLTALLDSSKRSRAFIDDPKSILGGIQFKYDSLKKSYKVFFDLDFLPLNGPVKLVDHEVQYRVWMSAKVRGIVRSVLNRALRPVLFTQTGRIASYVLNEAFNVIEMTYAYQSTKFEKALHMALKGDLETDISREELEKSLYLLYIKDNGTFINIILSGVQNQIVDIDSLYTYGKSTALNAYAQRQSISDANYSRMYFKEQCDLETYAYYFAKCENQGSLYSLISDQQVFFWSFGHPKIYNFDRPWEVSLMRSATYLLAGAVEINFLNFPNWISSQVSQALKSYSQSGLLDEAYLVSELQAKESLDSKQKLVLDEVMSKSVLPFVPRSITSLKRLRDSNRDLLDKKISNKKVSGGR